MFSGFRFSAEQKVAVKAMTTCHRLAKNRQVWHPCHAELSTLNYAPTMGVFSLRLLVKTMSCHPNKLRMNRKIRQNALRKAVNGTLKGRLLEAKRRPFANLLAVRQLARVRRGGSRQPSEGLDTHGFTVLLFTVLPFYSFTVLPFLTFSPSHLLTFSPSHPLTFSPSHPLNFSPSLRHFHRLRAALHNENAVRRNVVEAERVGLC